MLLKNGKELVIREARKEDAAELVNYLNIVGGESDNLTRGANEFDMTVEQEEAFIESSANNPSAALLVGTVDNQIVCSAIIGAQQHARLAHNAGIGMSVSKKYWGQGVGTHLMNALINFAKSTGTIEIIHLEVKADNERAIALYKKSGFQEIGRYPKKMKINNQYHDNILMNLYL